MAGEASTDGSSYVLEPQNPDREPTRREDSSAPAPFEAQQYSLDLTIVGNDGEKEQEFKQVEKHLYRRKFGGWYARLPDQKLRGTRHIPVALQTDNWKAPKQQSPKPEAGRGSQHLSGVCTHMFLKLPWKPEKSQKRQRLVFHRFQEDFVLHMSEQKRTTSGNVKNGNSVLTHFPPTGGGTTNEGNSNSVHPSSEQPKPSTCQSRTSQSLLWQHAEYKSLSISKFRKQVAICEDYGVSEGEHSLFDPHITDRLEHDFERSFTGGNYLRPVTLRYGIEYLGSATVDQACVFFSFPYLSLMKPQYGECSKDALDHIPRTLLQSKYRLHDTKDRDKSQRISSLGLSVLGKYITGSAADKQQAVNSLSPAKKAWSQTRRFLSRLIPGVSSDAFEERLHIPQLWGVLPGSNNLITCGTSSVDSLCGEYLRLASGQENNLPQARSLLKLHFDRNGHSEELFYPIDHCSSWYELLSKHLAVEEAFAQEIDKKQNPQGDSVTVKGLTQGKINQDLGKRELEQGSDVSAQAPDDPTHKEMEFSLQIEGQSTLLSSQGWIQYLEDHPNQEIFSVQIKECFRKDIVSKTSNGNLSETKEDTSQSKNKYQKQNLALPPEKSSHTNPADYNPNPTKTKPAENKLPDPDEMAYNDITFFEWRLRDEFNQVKKLSIKERASIFLAAIFSKMSVQKSPSTWTLSPATFEGHKVADVPISPTKFSELKTWFDDTSEPERSPNDPAERLFGYSKCVLMFFLPEHVVTSLDSGVLLLFWGAIKEILNRFKNLKNSKFEVERLEILSVSLVDIMKMAKKIHMGVRNVTQKSAPGADSQIGLQKGLMDRTVLLSAIVDAFSRILLLTVVAVAAKDDEGSIISKCTQDIIATLERAQGQLIREADKDINSDTPGPVLTPEGTAIALMNRLVSGTCGRASLDVIGMYELCLENMAIEVKFEASRGLLSELNEFVEEVTIINDVLKQQMNVLLQFRASLDPRLFYNAAIARHIQFRYESREIDKILIRIREQLQAFEELRERAKQLALENVQLVDTSQEQNGKYLFVFTVVTVFFLPATFVAGFFGMNLQGINPSPWGVKHFWEIAVPLTAGVVLVALVFARTIDDLLAAWSRWWNRKKQEWFGI